MSSAIQELNEKLGRTSEIIKFCPAKYCRALLAMVQIQEHVALLDLSNTKDPMVAAELRGYIAHCRLMASTMETILEGGFKED